MRSRVKNILAAVLCVALLCGLVGCQRARKEPRPAPKSTAKVDDGNTNAAESGDGQADVPLVIGCQSFDGRFNPFEAETLADRQAVSLTQVPLLIHDRAGKTVYHGIDGELREYNGSNYTYYSIADITVNHDEKKDETEYHITLRDDLAFSDGEKLTVDDLIFSLYVFCDSDYHGSVRLKGMPIKGLLEYQADSSIASSILQKKVKAYIKRMPDKLKRWKEKNLPDKPVTAQERESYDAALERQARIFLSAGKGKRVKNISGIQRINDYELVLVTTGYNRRMTAALEIPVCALHYYGDTARYNIEKGKFGFARGDISQVTAKKTAPLGAGPYRFVKHENNVVYYTSNELYYLGCPQIAYLQLKDMTDILKETRAQIKTKQKEYEAWEESQAEANMPEATEPFQNASLPPEETGVEPTPMPSVNPLAEVTEISGGTVDVMQASYSKADLAWIYGTDFEEQIAGRLLGDGRYHYIGINANAVAVKGKAGSRASKYLRMALAVVLSDSRRVLTESEDVLAELVDYPVVKESWVSPQESGGDYEAPYSTGLSGESGEQAADRALEYLEAAGYTVADGKVKKAPKGGALKYKVLLVNGERHLLYPMLTQAKQTLESIGITLEFTSVGTEKELYRELTKNKHQLWVGSRAKEDLELQLRYLNEADDNFFGIQDKKLDQAVEKLQTELSSDNRKKVYKKAFDIVLGWAVEVPVCEFQKVELFSTRRIDEDTVAKDTTIYYSWVDELQKVRMK